MVNYDIQVREIEGTLTNNNGKLVIRYLVAFEIKYESESPASLDTQSSQHNKIEHHIFSQAETELRYFRDSTYGVFVIKRKDVPTNKCQRGTTIWASRQALLHKGVTDHSNRTKSLALKLHETSTIRGRSSRITAVHELEVVILNEGDKQLVMPAIHGNNMDQWIYTRSLILSSVSSTELAADQDFPTLASSICEIQRSIIINQLRDVSSD